MYAAATSITIEPLDPEKDQQEQGPLILVCPLLIASSRVEICEGQSSVLYSTSTNMIHPMFNFTTLHYTFRDLKAIVRIHCSLLKPRIRFGISTLRHCKIQVPDVCRTFKSVAAMIPNECCGTSRVISSITRYPKFGASNRKKSGCGVLTVEIENSPQGTDFCGI